MTPNCKVDFIFFHNIFNVIQQDTVESLQEGIHVPNIGLDYSIKRQHTNMQYQMGSVVGMVEFSLPIAELPSCVREFMQTPIFPLREEVVAS